jgi:D-alanyl-D-alanine carboxypeptidase
MPIASLTKLITAVVSKQLISDNAKVKITNDIISTFGNTAQFKIGETFQAEDLYYPLLMVSSNDAAEALARNYGRQKFIQAMNTFAQSIGAYRTTFKDPSGLSPDNRSTVNDLVTIFSWIQKNEPKLIEITQIKTKTVRVHTWTNSAHFLSWSNYLGGKNGYTDEAKQTSIAVFYMGQDKVPYITVVLGSRSRDADILKLLGKVKL